tara:strand:+ start:336 stop:644 length:309 start_codon:yes stop_codon:yes gene_type:complete
MDTPVEEMREWICDQNAKERNKRADWVKVVFDNLWHDMRGGKLDFPAWCLMEVEPGDDTGCAEDIDRAILDIQARLCELRRKMASELAELQAENWDAIITGD